MSEKNPIRVFVTHVFEETHDYLRVFEFLESVGVTPILVATKIDKLPASKRKPAVAALRRELDRPLIAYSSVTGDGRDALWKRVLSVSSIHGPDDGTRA